MFNVIEQHRVDAHQYADDLQLYLCVPPAEASVATDLLNA
jgi:Na+-transporting NADH:ubiquinone oxidoreductase subunit NqrF